MLDKYILKVNKYILKGKKPIPIDNILEWIKWFETVEAHVDQTALKDGKWISTVFLGVDHSFDFTGRSKPILFETMVFENKHKLNDLDMARYSTWAEAKKGHKRMVKKWEKRKKVK